MSPAFRRIAELLARLPGVGEKTANRYLLYLLSADPALSSELGDRLKDLHQAFGPCADCNHIAERSPDGLLCSICRDHKRDSSTLCVVAKVTDVIALEKPQTMRGRYFVLGSLLSPLEGIGPERLQIPRLIEQVKQRGVREVILATPPSVDGEATAMFLRRELEPLGLHITRIASGIPHGGDLEFVDSITIGRALDGRKEM